MTSPRRTNQNFELWKMRVGGRVAVLRSFSPLISLLLRVTSTFRILAVPEYTWMTVVIFLLFLPLSFTPPYDNTNNRTSNIFYFPSLTSSIYDVYFRIHDKKFICFVINRNLAFFFETLINWDSNKKI